MWFIVMNLTKKKKSNIEVSPPNGPDFYSASTIVYDRLLLYMIGHVYSTES